MAKIVRMTADQARQWRQNIPQLIFPDGKVHRAVSVVEEEHIGVVTEECRLREESKEVEVLGRPLKVDIRRTGAGPGEFVMRVYYDKARPELESDDPEDGEKPEPVWLEKVTARDVIKKWFVNEYGVDCQLRYPNGTVAAMARDPDVKRPTYKDSNRLAPNPDNCECREWGGRPKGKHHYICPHNRYAPPDEQSSAPVTPTEVPLKPKGIVMSRSLPGAISSEPKVTHTEVATPIVQQPTAPPNVPEPEECVCKAWQKPEGADPKKHHPLCAQAPKWEALHRDPSYIVDLDTYNKVREATEEETAEAGVRRKKTGDSVIALNGIHYAVMTQKALDAAIRDKKERVDRETAAAAQQKKERESTKADGQ